MSPSDLPERTIDLTDHLAREALDVINTGVAMGWNDRRIINRAKAVLRRTDLDVRFVSL